MGGGGFLGLGPAPSAPAAPNYSQLAKDTAASNLQAAQTATAANRVNQITPYGNLTYSETGTDSQGNPTWTANTSLSDVGQQLLNNQNNASLGLGTTINSALDRTQNMMGQGFNPNLPSTGFNAGQSYQDAYMQRLAPQIEQSRESTMAQLANQGIVQGTKAYDNAMRTQAMRENDLLLGATTQGFDVGTRANQQAFNQELTKYNIPLNTLSALRSGAQVQNPSFVNSAAQANTSGADLLGAGQMGYNAQMGDFNAKQAAQQNLNSGLFSLGGSAMMMSDIRTKENIVAIGTLPNGLPFYQFEYKPEFKDHPSAGHGLHTGVMAQEVQAFMPEAVITLENGYLAVDYGKLNA